MNDIEIILETIGLYNPTKVTCNGRVLVTRGLDLETTAALWKWYYHIAPFQKIILKCATKTYNALNQRPLSSVKSCIEIFADNGVVCQEVKE